MERDLHTLLTSVRDDAPPPRLSVDDITAAGRHLVRRRRRNALLSSAGGGVVTAIAAVTAALMLAGGPSTLAPAVDPSSLPSAASPAPTAFAAAPAFTTTYKGFQANGYKVSDPDVVTNAYQQSSIDGAGPILDPSPQQTVTGAPGARPGGFAELYPGGSLVVYRPDAFDPSMFLKFAEKIPMPSGEGLLAYSGGGTNGPLAPSTAAKAAKDRGQPIPALAWQYMDGAWAAIYWSSWENVPTRDDLVAIAEGLTPAAPRPFPVAFQSANPIKGYHLLAASYGGDVQDAGEVVSSVRLIQQDVRLPIFEPYDFADLGVLTLAAGRTDAGPKLAGRLDCDGDRLRCTKVLDSGTVFVMAEADGYKSPAGGQLTQITLGIKPQNLDNGENWPTVTKVYQ
ncbi:hypothetical protein [Dactylosporangium matsuzakiense]|uniref:Uncharacterized protein n=1 Tax=Dactylosporangium matsuzakiense TaxID=53360 RepID=A0A9W6NNZ4_9ACTN|nr:hypothetical protein [Dactylosporangium matsuzakiense]UWZ42907.1 hypothetical protein Dmats_36140 [Dactylosporangium matsuzakiense]GLL03959.1 hypothetical protein GCM10017581_057050 [Dactylosporangium matsuzakiense]